MPMREGASFAGFAIVRLVGAAGMGEVYVVQHPRLPRLQALRVLPPALSANPEYRARFQREADLAASLSHPNIVGVHDRGEHQGQLWILMGYIEGVTAGRLLREHYPRGLPRAEALHIVGSVADALDYAHERGLLHRSVSPANIMLVNAGTPHQRVLLADLGIARRVGGVGGVGAASLDYTAPEQLLDMSFEGRADQYSLAATAYHLLSGVAPFTHPNPVVVSSRHLHSPPPRLADTRPDLADVDAALARALAKDPGARFRRCQDFAAALGADTYTRPVAPPTHTPPPAPPPPPGPPPNPYAGSWPTPGPWPPPGWGPPPERRARRWWVAAAAALVVVVVATITGVALSTAHRGGAAGTPASTTGGGPSAVPVASANDTGPAGIITEEPTCQTWEPIGHTWLVTAPTETWDKTHPGQQIPVAIPAASWSAEQRAAMQATANATRLAATKTTALARTTPHRVVRELYEIFVIYGRAFADSIDNNYLPGQGSLGAAAESAFNTLVSLCQTIDNGVAAARAGLVTPLDAPSHPAPPQDLAHPERVLTPSDLTVCGEIRSLSRTYNDNPTFKDWDKSDQLTPANLWSPEQRALNDAVAPLMLNLADDMQRTVARSNNPVMQDLGNLAAQYQRVFAKALPSHAVFDNELDGVGHYSRYVLKDACDAVGS